MITTRKDAKKRAGDLKRRLGLIHKVVNERGISREKQVIGMYGECISRMYNQVLISLTSKSPIILIRRVDHENLGKIPIGKIYRVVKNYEEDYQIP